jgi:phosphopantothenoylcysteine decarboxylase / phosphopantothenate---cysteine ligase
VSSKSLRILITAGPTREPLDPVRFISNASTGAQGAALAEEALRRGHAVDLVHGPLEVDISPGAAAHPVLTAAQMLERCLALHARCDAVIGAAAVSDFRPRETLESKRRREGEGWRIELVPTEDILAALGKEKGSRIHAGFALETEDFLENAARKLRAKSLDWIVMNSPDAIGRSRNHYVILGADGTSRDLGILTKVELAAEVLGRIEASSRNRQR